MSDIYDGAFRTIINDCRQFVLPFINEVFGETYDGTEKIEFHPNEHFVDQPNGPDVRRITDSNFTVIGKEKKNYHLECESSHYSSKILIRLFEYDAQIALDDGTVGKDSIKVTFPHTAVLYLRDTGRTPEKLHVIIEVPGDMAEYDVPIAKIVKYSIDEIFEKKLYLLIPFYIFTYEKEFEEYNNNEEKLLGLKAEYQKIIDRMNGLVEREELTTFDRRTVIELSDDVMEELTKKYENLQKGVGELMAGALIETDVRKARDEGYNNGLSEGISKGISKGISQGIVQAMNEVAENMIKAQKPANEIHAFTGLSIEALKKIAQNLGISLVM